MAKRQLKGTIISDKMNKTRTVAVTSLKKNARYQKYYKVTKKFKAHDENNEYKMGDAVVIEETRPLSKDKRFKIVSKI